VTEGAPTPGSRGVVRRRLPGVWCLVFGVWCLVVGVDCLVDGVWC
jgi:hypothetical protein